MKKYITTVTIAVLLSIPGIIFAKCTQNGASCTCSSDKYYGKPGVCVINEEVDGYHARNGCWINSGGYSLSFCGP